MPCNEEDRPNDVGFSLLTMGMLDVLVNLPVDGEDIDLILSDVWAYSHGNWGQTDLSISNETNIQAIFDNPKNQTDVWLRMERTLPDGKTERFNVTITKNGVTNRSKADQHLAQGARTIQINQKIATGPDRGVHRYHNIPENRGGVTGITRGYRGKEYRGTNTENPARRNKQD